MYCSSYIHFHSIAVLHLLVVHVFFKVFKDEFCCA